ncbi:MAG: hypothetical protein INR71_05585, partial [Terriglobus roseus]|nr:hypothetical protein [Terriglobus roseus]
VDPATALAAGDAPAQAIPSSAAMPPPQAVAAEKPASQVTEPPVSAATAQSLDIQPTPAEEIAQPIRTPQQKKKVVAKGKTCWILLPPDVPRDVQGAPLKPMTPSEVAEKFSSYERQGYDTRGFSHWSGAAEPYNGDTRTQNRPVFPEGQDLPRSGPRPPVRIPNKQSWDDYMNWLTEQKLAALGVTLNDAPPPSSAPMSRQSSSQYPTSTFSPPPLSSSATSHQQIPGFPPGFVPGHASRQSMASPISSIGNPRHMGHMHRQSMFVSPPSFPPQPTPPGMARWSPQHFSHQSVSGNISAASPSVSAIGPLSAGGTKSPVSPFQFPATQGFPFNARDDLLVQMQRQQQQQLQAQQQRLQAQQQQQQMHAQPQIPSFRPMSVPQNLEGVPEVEDEEEVPVQKAREERPQLANPRPRHSKNVSVQLERDAEKDGYHLENYIKKQFIDDEQDVEAAPEVQAPKAETPAKQPDVAPEPAPKATATADTTPSSKAEEALDLMTSPTSESFTSGHASKASSISRLNVEAKEFKFNPSAFFNPGSLPANAFNFQAAKPAPFSPPASAPLNGLGANFRPAAQEFNPSASTGSNSSLFGNKDFSFVSNASFNPGASAFQPGRSLTSDTDSAPDSGKKIFGNINFSDIVKPAKKSKAIPIVRPEDVQLPPDDEHIEDETGRLVQADGRQKRARQDRDDGGEVPRFAFPSHPLDDEKTPEPDTIQKALDKEGSATPTNETALVHQLPSPDSGSNRLDDSGFQDGSAHSDVSLFQKLSSAVGEDKPRPKHGRNKSSLSATAKPFEFKPWSMSGHHPNQNLSISELEDGEVEDGEIINDVAQQMKDQLPASSPIVNISDQDEAEPDAPAANDGETGAEDKPFDIDLHASFDNIDEVMKHLNEEGSDVGVERTEPSWQQQSSSRPATATTFDTPDLKPPQLFRSDAPSPSPRRLAEYA